MSNILIGAIVLSIWCNALFYGKAIGLSMILFIVPLTCFMIYFLEKNGKIKNKKAKILIIPIVLLSSIYFIYNNQFFNTLNIIVIPLLVVIMFYWMLNEKILFNGRMIREILEIIFKPICFLGKTVKKYTKNLTEKKNINTDSNKTKNTKKVIKAILITLPIAFTIILLLSSADEAFGNIFANMFDNIFGFIGNIQISALIERIILITIAFLYFLCLFDYLLSSYVCKDIPQDYSENKLKDDFTIKMILGALNVIYLVFCYIQIKSFIQNVNIHYANFARQGFFQLMIVSIINLVAILIAKKVENKASGKKYIKIMCIVMILFTFIILISSALRMHLYEAAYGYTLLRLLVYCSLFTEAVLLIPTILYVLDKKVDLAKTYFIIILSIYICMNFANFDYIIAKRNIDRYLSTGKIDLEYLERGTNTDATSQILRVVTEKEDKDINKLYAKRILKRQYNRLNNENMDFRDFNISKILAKKKIAQNLEILDNITEKDFDLKWNLKK